MMKNFLVTGGAGFIGSHLVDRLLSTDVTRVTVVDDFNDFYEPAIKRENIREHLKDPRYSIHEIDIRDRAALEPLFKQTNFDCIVHLAARAGVRPSLSEPQLYSETNINGTLNLLELARQHNIKQFVFGSSSSVYGINAHVPFSEDDPIRQPISPYAATKAAGELLCHTYSHLYGLRCVCLRFFTVYGPRQRPDLAIHKFAKLISQRKPIPVFGDGTTRRDYTYIDDIIDGVVAADPLRPQQLRHLQPRRIANGRAQRADFAPREGTRHPRDYRPPAAAAWRCSANLRRHFQGASEAQLQSHKHRLKRACAALSNGLG